MNATELRELDAWIAEHVMGYRWWFDVLALESMLCPPSEIWPERKGFKLSSEKPFGTTDLTDLSLFKPTTDPAAAMAVLEKCLLEKGIQLSHYKGFGIYQTGLGKSLETHADTLPMTICLFAQKLFSK